MRTLKNILLGLSFLTFSSVYGQKAFEYGIPNRDINHSFYPKQSAQLSNGKIVTVGYNTSVGGGQFIIYNANGDTSKTHLSVVTNFDNTYKSVVATANGFIVLGDIATNNDRDLRVQKFNNSGQLLWTQVYSGVNDQYANSVMRMTNGDIVIGNTTNYNVVELLRTDSSGVALTGWPKTLLANSMGTHNDPNRCVFYFNGSHIIAAVQDHWNNNKLRVFTVNPQTGTVGQDTLFGSNNNDVQPRDIVSIGSKIFITGYRWATNEGRQFIAAWDTAIGASGNWYQNNIDMSAAQGGHTSGIAIQQRNGDLYVLGQGWIQNVGWHLQLRKISIADGSTIWSKQYVGDGEMSNSERSSLLNLPNGQFLIVSSMRRSWRVAKIDNGNYLTYFARVNADGSLNNVRYRLGDDFQCYQSNQWVYPWCRDRYNTYNWTQPNGNTNTSDQSYVSDAGDYFFSALDYNGDAVNSDTISVYQPASPIIYNDLGSFDACAGDTIQLNAFSTVQAFAAQANFNWYLGGNLVNSGDSAIYVTTGGTYELREIDTLGCAGVTSQVVNFNNPLVQIVEPTANFNLTLGDGSVTNAATPNPDRLSAPWGYFTQNGVRARNQYIVKVSELQAMGLKPGMQISSIAFDVQSLGLNSQSANYVQDFSLSLANSPSGFNGFGLSGSSKWASINFQSDRKYYDSWFYLGTSSGWRILNFNQNGNFIWDGVSDLIVDIQYNGTGGAGSTNYQFSQTVTSHVSSKMSWTTSISNSTGNVLNLVSVSPTSSSRPNMRFSVTQVKRDGIAVACESPVQLGLSYSNIPNINSALNTLEWTQGSSIGGGVTFTSSSPGQVIFEFTDAIGCLASDTVFLKFGGANVSIQSTVGDTSCSSSPILLTALGAGPSDSYSWSNGATTNSSNFGSSGTATVTVIDSLGCTSSDSIELTILDPVKIYTGINPAKTGTTIQGFAYLGNFSGKYVYASTGCATYALANSNAINLGGNLLTIKSNQEWALITSALRQYFNNWEDFYIGLNDQQTEGQWVWTSGSSSTWKPSNWGLNEPSGGTNENVICIRANGFDWFDVGEQNCYKYLIEFDENLSELTNANQCDSVLLFGPYGFDTYEWLNSLGAVIDSGRSKYVSSNSTIALRTTKNFDNSTACTETTSNYTVNIVNSPVVSITNVSSSFDLIDSLNFLGVTGAPVFGWQGPNGFTSMIKNIWIKDPGTYTFFAEENGCRSERSVTVYQPIFVSKGGNDVTGNGTLNAPFLTIQKGIDTAPINGKVYVLPGTYTESVNITKSVFVASDYQRLGHIGAIDSTIISSANGNYVVRVSGSFVSDTSYSKLVGFTLTGKTLTGNEEGAFTMKDVNGSPSGVYLLKEVKIVNNTLPCCSDWSGSAIHSSGHNAQLVMVGGEISNNNLPQQDHRGVIATNRDLIFSGVRIINNFGSQGIFKVWEAPTIQFINTLLAGNVIDWNDHALFTVPQWGGTTPELNFINATIADNESGAGKYFTRDGNLSVRLLNSIWKTTTVLANTTFHSTGEITASGSVLPDSSVVPSSKYSSTHIASQNVYGNFLGLNPNYTLGASSSAIGLGVSSSTLNGELLSSPSHDLAKGIRPNPAGSNPDAGVFESPLGQGTFSVSIENCGYELRPVISNAGNYLTSWTGPNGFTSSLEVVNVTEVGTYTLEVQSLDRNDTITVSYNLTSPLDFDLITAKDVCQGVSTNSGAIRFGRVRGGQPYDMAVTQWWTYLTRFLNTNGQQIYGTWNVDGNNANWEINQTGLTAGTYIVEVEDASGCKVQKQVVLASKLGRKVYVSTTGLNTNAGTQSAPYATVQHAVDQSCDRDTIILLNGTYNQDSIIVNKPLIIASNFLITGDTNDIRSTVINGSNNRIFTYQGFYGALGDTARSMLVGLSIQNGVAAGRGGGVLVRNYNGEPALKINSCNIRSNYANEGGGIAADSWVRLVVANSYIRDNVAVNSGGGVFSHNSWALYLRNTSIIGNSANDAGGISNSIAPYSGFENLKIVNNSSIGGTPSAYLSGNSGTKFRNIVVSGNIGGPNSNHHLRIQFDNWNSPYSGDELKIFNLLMSSNITQGWSGLYLEGGNNFSFINCTFVDNVSRNGSNWNEKGQIVLTDNVSVRLLNSIVTLSNGRTIIANGCSPGSVTIRNSAIEGGATGIQNESCSQNPFSPTLTSPNVTTAPYFVDRANGDYRLAKFSSLIGYGAASASMASKTLTAPLMDITGAARPQPANTNPDVGVYEHPDSIGSPGLNLIVTNNGSCQTANGAATVNLIRINNQPSGTPIISWIKLNDPTWTPQTTNTISGLSSGSYQVTVTVGTSAPFIDTAVVTTAAPMSLVNNSLLTNCFGGNDGTLKFSIQGGSPFTGGTYKYDVQQLTKDGGVASYTDNSTQERSANFMATQRSSGTYRISITDAKGCQLVDTITLGYRNALPTAQITASGPLTFCEGDAVSLDATTANATDMYSWNDGSNLAINTVGTSGSWIVTVTDTAGCSNSDTVVVDVKATPVVLVGGAPPIHTGGPISGYSYVGQVNGEHIYYSNNCVSWQNALQQSQNIGGEFFTPESSAENALVTNWWKSQYGCCGRVWVSAKRDPQNAQQHILPDGQVVTYTNWGSNEPQSGQDFGKIDLGWDGQWAGEEQSWNCAPYFVKFRKTSRQLQNAEAFCDSVTVSAPEGFDSYVWKNTANNNAVVGTSRSLTVTSSMSVKVEGTLNKSNNTTCTLESQTHTITINQTPAASIVNHSGTTDLYGNDTVVLGANVATGATWSWSNPGSTTSLGSNDTLLVTSPNSYVLSAINAGCERRDSVRIDEPLFVSVSGSNATGNGSFAAPYRTIQKGVNQASSGGKVYVLPGNYVESVVVTKPVKIYSDFERLGSTTAIGQTKITSQNGNFSIAIRMDSTGAVQNFTKQNMHISGFTIQGKNASNDMGAIDICPAPSFDWNNVNKQKGEVLISNIDFTNNTTQANNASAFASRGNEVHTYFENIKVRNSNIGVDPRGVLYFWQTKGATFNNAQIFGNDGIVFNVDGQNMNMTFNNTAVFNNDIKGTTWGGYFNIQGSNNTLEFLNSTLSGNIMASQDARLFRTNNGSGTKVILKNSILNTSGSPVYSGQVSFEARNSLLPLTSVLALADFTYYDTTNVHSSVARVQGYELLPNSPAIGIGSVQYATATDIDGKNRPLPAGTNPDAGAFESNLAFGELDLAITSCGYQVAATVLNSKNYSISWSGPGGYSSTQTSPLLPLKGIYQATLIAFDRQDTIVRTLNLNNPLEFTISSVKDVCEGVSVNSGSISWGNIRGGINNSNPNEWWWKKSSVLNVNGSQFDGEWWIGNDPNWSMTRSGMPAGTFIIRVVDGSGCAVFDTVVIGTQPSNTFFISTTGSDSALGTASNPLKTISEALTRACDGDTIILEDGRHYENVIMGNNAPRLTIASRYLLDGDTNHIHNAIVDGMDVNPVFNISDLNNRGTTDTLRLFGFTVTNGLANSGWNGGGGISARWSNVSLVKIRAVENRSGQNGGGIGIWECDLKLKDVLIKDNFATNDGGGLHLQYINNDLLNTNVRIVGNQSSNGGGLYYSHGLGNTGQVYELDGFEIINNLATNQGGGIFFGCWSGEADVQLSNSKVIGNRATNQSGGIVVQSNNADFFFVNDIIAKNESGYAGAMSINNSKVHFVHSTAYSNKHILGSTSSVLNLAVHVENQSTLKLYNSILGGQGTGGQNVYIQDNNSNFEIVSGQLGGGVSNTVQAPNASQIIYSSSSPNYTNQQVFLKDPNGGDFSLAKVSQAIGRGLTSFTNGPVLPLMDIYGNARPNLIGSDPDLGAIESSDTAASFGAAFVVSDNNACNPSIGQITAYPQNGSGAYTYSWTSLNGGIISNPTGSGASHTIANLFTGQYRVVVTDVVTNATFVDTATVRGDSPLTLNKTVTNEGCQGTNSGGITIDVVGGSGFYTYTWLLPNGGGTLNTKNISNLAPGVYSVTVTDNKGCSVSSTDTVGTDFAQPTLTITSQILKPGGTSVAGGNDVRMCIGDQVVFNAGSGFDYYEWNKSDGLNTEYSQTVSSYISETYSVYVEDTNGCSTTGTAKIFVVYEPNVYASNVNRTMGQQFQQVTSYVRGDTTAQSNVAGNEVSPYNAQGNSLKKSQFVISASELQGAGLTENTTINSLAFDVVNPAGVAFQAYKIKLAHTSAQQLGTWQSPAAQQEVFAIPVYAPVQGWNTHNFTSSFAWNGVDNLLVEVCYTPIGNSMNSAIVRVNQVATANNLTNFSYSANSCSDPVPNWQMGSSTWRPTVRFGIDKVEVLDTIRVCDFTTLNTTDDYDTYTWYVNGVASPTAALSLNLTVPATVVLAATDAASSCVMYSDTFYVALDSTPTVLATSNLTGAVCAGDSVVLSTPSAGLASYLWSNGDTTMTTTVFESGAYLLEARSANGCVGTDTVVVTVNTPPTVVVKLNGKTLTATDGSLATKVNTCVQSVLLPFGENFEDSLYVWTQATTDQLDWTFNSGATNTQFSGPNGDFTTLDSSGNYYYLDRAGSNSDDNKEAHLISPCVQMIGANRPYLTFGYHMYNGLYNAANPSSDNMGTLRIEVQTTDDAANYWVPLWTKTGHQGIGWKSDTVDLTQFAGQTIRLRIVGKAGVGGPRSEMAIDGISIIDTANSFANTSGRISADIICEGDLLIAQTISNGSTQFNYVWNTGDTTSALKVDTTGYYFVSVFDENGCSIQTDSVWIEVSPIPDNALVVTGDLSNCYNDTVAVTVQAPMNYSKYSWFSNDSTIVPSGATTTLVSMQGLAIGNYALGVRIFDSIGCAAISDTVFVNRYVQPMIQDSAITTQCFGDSTGAIFVQPVTGPMTWNWNNGDTTANPTGLLSGSYQVIFTDEHGCSDTATVFVPQPTELTTLATVQDVQCNDETNGSLILNVSGATTPYWLDWSTTGVDSGLTRVTLALDMRNAGASVSPSVSIVGIASNIQMNSPLNDGIYYVTVERQPNTILYYRFYNGSNPELVPLACGINPPSLTTLHRNLLVGSNDTTLNRVCFASCVDCDGQVTGARSEVLVGGSTTISSQGSGVITLTIVDANGCSVTINDTIVQPDAINIQLDTIVDVSCPQAGDGAIQLTTFGGIMPYAFDWSNGDTIEDLLTVNEGTYTITVTDFNGCVDTASYEIMAPMPYNFEEICMMTVDSLTGKNQVVWNKTPGQRTMEYQIFKETNIAGQYAQIGTVPYLNMSVFTDVNSVPQQQPDRYKIIAVDSCGNPSDTSDLHRTIHLQSNFGSGGEVNLSWTDYEGRTVQTYDIYRWVSAGNLVQIGSVSGATTTFSDLNPPVAPNVYYNVRAVFAGGACAPAAGKTSSYESARSNILDQTGIGMPDLPWKGLARMFPNPTASTVRIEVPESGFVVRVTNLLGQLIHETSVQESTVVLDLGHVAAGMYQVELYRDGQVMSIDKLHVVH